MDTQEEEMIINLNQQKVISNPLRARIIVALYEKPMTPKQTALKLNKNPGTIYYHIQQLFKNDILIVDHIESNRGIVEKYYRAKAMLFRLNEESRKNQKDQGMETGSNSYTTMSKELAHQMNKEVQELFFKYHQLSLEETAEQNAYILEFNIKHFRSGEDEDL